MADGDSMTEKYCKQCGEPIPKDNNWGIKQYCDKKCYCEAKGYNYYGPKIEKIVCQNPDCPREGEPFKPKQRNRGTYCSRECAYAVRSKNKKEPLPYWWPKIVSKPVKYCANCGDWMTGRGNDKYCSDECRKKKARDKARDEHVPTPPSERTCPVCSSTFMANYNTKYCSSKCKRWVYKRKYGSGSAGVSDKQRQRIYKRDRLVCQSCNRKTRPDYHCNHNLHPSIDHIVPVVLDGTDDDHNLQVLCRLCNSIKSDGSLGCQLKMAV